MIHNLNNIYLLASLSLIIAACEGYSISNKPDTQSAANPQDLFDSVFAKNLFPLQSAEKILGERANQVQSEVKIGKAVSSYNSGFLAVAPDTITDKTGSIYFGFEQYATIDSAKRKFEITWESNRNHEGAKKLKGIGDETYYHTDSNPKNFYLIVVRKGARIFGIKVNKITSHTSEREFMAIARLLAQKI